MATEQPTQDPVNPAHYKGDYVMRIIEDFELDFCLGNVVKYICRHGKKAGLEDLKKAKWYLERAISHLEPKQPKIPPIPHSPIGRVHDAD